MAISFKEFNNKMCLVDFESQEFPEKKETYPALIFDCDTFNNEEIIEFLEDELGDEIYENPKYSKPFGVIFMPHITEDLYNDNLFLENINSVIAYLIINPKNNKIFRSGWGEIDLKVEDLNIRLKN